MQVSKKIPGPTARLRFRQLEISDVNDVFQIVSDPETMQYYPGTMDMAQAYEWVQLNMMRYRQTGFGFWALEKAGTREFIGQCGITWQNIDDNEVPEIGYHLNRRFWNKGLATEAAGACLSFGFLDLGFDEIFIHTSIDNLPSRRVAEKRGMTWRKDYDKYIKSHQISMKHAVYSMKRESFQTR